MKKSYLLAFLIAAGATAWILSGQVGTSRATPEDPSRENPTTGAQVSIARPATVRVRVNRITAQRQQRELRVRGRTEASRHVTLRAQTSGRIVEIAAAKGSRVDKHDPVVRIAEDDRPAHLNEAKALVAQRRLEYEAAAQLKKKGFRAATKYAESRAQLESAKAMLARIQTDLGHTRILAPFAATLEERPVEVGDFVDVGDKVAMLVDLDPILVVAYASERDIGQVAAGGRGTARLVTGETLQGRIRYVASMADATTHTYRVELEADNPDLAIREGTTAELLLPAETRMAHLVSPAFLSLDDAGRVGIKMVDDDERVEYRPVTILDDGPEGVWLGGLPDEITVITVGHEFVQTGQVVTPVMSQDASRQDALQ